MAALILPSRRVVQPQGPVEIDPRYKGAVARLNIPAFSLIDLATGQAATTTGSATSTAIFSNRQGFEKQVHPSSGALGYSSWSWGPDDGITDDATFLFVGHPQNYSTANGGLIIRGLTSTWNLGLYYTNGNTLNAGTVTSSPVAGFTASIGSLSLTIGDEQRCLLSRRGGLITVYNWRTRQQSSTSVTGTGLRNSTTGISIGATISSGAASHQRHALTGVLKQGVTDSEAWALLENPWQLFRPIQRRIWVPVAGGGGAVTHTGTGALTGAGSTLAGTASSATTRTASGALIGAGSVLAGSASRIDGGTTHDATGVLVGAGSTVSGAASRTRVFSSVGVLQGAGALLSGSADRTGAPTVHSASGALLAAGSALSGAAQHNALHTSTGALSGAGSALAGSASRAAAAVTHDASGALVGRGSLLNGTAQIGDVLIDTHDGFWAKEWARIRAREKRKYQAEVQERVEEIQDEIAEVEQQIVEVKQAPQPKKATPARDFYAEQARIVEHLIARRNQLIDEEDEELLLLL